MQDACISVPALIIIQHFVDRFMQHDVMYQVEVEMSTKVLEDVSATTVLALRLQCSFSTAAKSTKRT